MGHDRSLVRHAFEDDNSVIDTKDDIPHGVDKTRPRKELNERGRWRTKSSNLG